MEARPAAPHPSRVDNLLGVISIKQAHKDRAAFYFKRAIQEDKAYAPAHYNLGLLYMGIQETHKGREALREAARLNVRYKEILSPQGIFSDEGGDGDRTD